MKKRIIQTAISLTAGGLTAARPFIYLSLILHETQHINR